MKSVLASFLGGLVGAFMFLVAATFFLGDPFGDWFLSAHGMLGADELKELNSEDRVEIYKLLNRGLVVTTDGVLSSMADLYGNMIQVLIGGFAVVTALGFFAVRWQSVQAAQDFMDEKSKAHFSSPEFQSTVRTNVVNYVDSLDPNMNPNVFGMSNDDLAARVSELSIELELVKAAISGLASAEEPIEREEDTDI